MVYIVAARLTIAEGLGIEIHLGLKQQQWPSQRLLKPWRQNVGSQSALMLYKFYCSSPSYNNNPSCSRRLNPTTWWSSLDLDGHTLLLMMKAALTPTIVVALARIPAVSHVTDATNDAAALVAVTSHVLMPRGKFVKVMLFNVLAVCLGACVACMALVSATRAGKGDRRVDATTPKTQKGYSSDANTVSAVWLIVVIWLANAMRSWRPIELQSPVIAFSIFTCFNITQYGGFETFEAGVEYMLSLLRSMLIAFAVASVVSLFILPMTSRTFFLKDARDYSLKVQAVLQQQSGFVRMTVENPAVWFADGLPRRFQPIQSSEAVDGTDFSTKLEESKQKVHLEMSSLGSLFSKLQVDLLYSKQEFAIGKLSTEDAVRIEELLGSLLLPLSGISMLPRMLDMHIKNERNYQMKVLERDSEEEILQKQAELHKAITTLQKHLSETATLAATGIQYFLLVTKLMSRRHFFKYRESEPPATVPKDEESRDIDLDPLEPYFVVRFERLMHETFCRRRHFPGQLASLAFNDAREGSNNRASSKKTREIITSGPQIRLEFFLVLYMGHMQDILLHTTHELIKFADSKVADGTMTSYRAVFPTDTSLKRWFSLVQEEPSEPSDSTPDENQGGEEVHPQDSEHMPPANLWEKSSHIFRLIRRVIISEHSLFGFRVAAASFCVGILAFLERTSSFFIPRRLVWVMILIVIGMNPTTGETCVGLMSRIIGSTISVFLSLIVWYTVDENTAGIIILLYFANMFEYWFYIKRPQVLDSSVIAIATLNEIIATKLEVREAENPELAGLANRPTWVFALHKILAVGVACGLMIFWTIFPFTITAKHKMRRMLGESIFVLAEFYSATHTNSALWFSGGLRDGLRDPQALLRQLERVIRRLFRKEMVLLDELREYSHFSKFEPAIGGKFPRRIYDDIILEVQCSLTAMALMVKTTQSLEKLLPLPLPQEPTTSAEQTTNHEQKIEQQTEQDEGRKESLRLGEPKDKAEKKRQEKEWFTQLGKVALETVDFKSARLASFLSHLSASVTNKLPLPPYLSAPSSFPLSRRMQKMNKNLLHVRYLEDPAFTAFITLEVLRSIVAWCMRDLLSNVKKLVGELNFEYHISRTESHGEAASLVAGGPAEESEEKESDEDSSSSTDESQGKSMTC
ncbi:conserved hypothetical protein [Talaromyces stipitatus ATCC 10500]|uniref:Uncharacterized protein n=1 Tax=Talaromyces stipitatus (strain ATCC 10500 / CBS 375.48 / QM 6759 / NRRL 1006) TaxID=441959 RepID=B8LVR1_TALSN|nr:uncharacterized protein TSTA_075620 [Talaromyces stipitatus ATCC 10500]EED24191.1 conserved hypothetical protein [Talaromyces stipitatus ATCC 10500]